ncbi:MAG: nitroreductase [Veillonellaceae bacterium]|jgi:nitroreductase/NAD-dependent dihydropyrimidine dehydrogenase PreA subunit|nr:nitroreductase [Veillonellaceae bacterium]
MAIKSSRTNGVGMVTIDHTRCSGCRLCVSVCKGAPLKWENNRVVVDQTEGFGCYGCGHCMAVCPVGCIFVDGRCLSSDDVFDFLPTSKPADYNQLIDLMRQRRSIRNFTEEEVSSEAINNIIAAAATAPMGIPPSEVGVVVISGRRKVRAFAADIVAQIRSMKWQISKPAVYMMRPLMSKDSFEVFLSFVPVLFEAIDEGARNGQDLLFYDAPLVMMFHVSAFVDPVDSYIAATFAMLAAEAQGLGSCMIGSVAPVIKNSNKLKQKYGIPANNQPGLAMIFGHPAISYRRGVQRTLASVKYI